MKAGVIVISCAVWAVAAVSAAAGMELVGDPQTKPHARIFTKFSEYMFNPRGSRAD